MPTNSHTSDSLHGDSSLGEGPAHRIAANATSRPLYLLLATSASFWLVSLIFCTIARHRRLDELYRSPFFPRDTDFGDLLIFRRAMQHIGSVDFFHTGPRFAYPAAAAIFYRIIYLFPHPTSAYLAFILATALGLLYIFARKLHSIGMPWLRAAALTAAVFILAFPFWVNLQRANIEWIVFLLCATGTYCFLSRRQNFAAACWGTAAAVKLFPIFYLVLLLRKGHWRAAFIFASACIAATLAGLRILNPNIVIANREVMVGLLTFKHDYTEHLRPIESLTDHALFCTLKRVLSPWVQNFSGALPIFLLVSGLVLLLLWMLRLRHMPARNQLIAATLCMLIFMPTSLGYTMLHLYTIFGIVAVAAVWTARDGSPSDGTSHNVLRSMLVLLACATVPLTWMVYQGIWYYAPAETFLLLTLLVLAVGFPIHAPDASQRSF